eukprot:scaffold60001_cov82-Cyclotella_meneghiniana.AAC.5
MVPICRNDADEEAEPLNTSPYAPSRIDDAQSPFKKWSFRLGMITLAAIAGYSAFQSSNASVQVSDVAMLTHHHDHHVSSKSGKSKKDVTELKSSPTTELFDDDRK